MSSVVNDFIASLGGPGRAFPPSLRQTYVELVEQFRVDPVTKGFDHSNRRFGLQDPSPQGVAHRVFWWLPTHFSKFQDALLKWEQQCQQSGHAMLLDRPKVIFVDLGCGAGAASVAVLAVLEQYQEFCRSRNIGIDPITVNLIGLDLVRPELDVYERLVGTYASRLASQQISVNVQTIGQGFPEGMPQLMAALSPQRGHALLVGMSNLIKWIWNEYDEHLKTNELVAIQGVQPAEADALRRMAEQADFDSFHVIGVATKKPAFLPDKLSALFGRLAAIFKLVDRPFGDRWSSRATVLFENPQGSAWASSRPQYPSNYFVDNLMNIAPEYACDRKLASVLSAPSLEAAWVKVRSYTRYESLTDEVELKLFENDLDANLRRLRAACLERDYRCLDTDHHLPYDFPKDEVETRPRSLAKLEDQIIAAAVCIGCALDLEGPCPEVSYSHRLAPVDTEFLYEYWFVLYRKYLTDTLKRLDNKYVCTTDIRSFYLNIQQDTLLDIARQRIQSSDRCCELLETTIARDCQAPHESGFGLLQGHALSGFLANVMLQPVDSELIGKRGMKGRYFRFADDFTVVGASDPDKDAILPI